MTDRLQPPRVPPVVPPGGSPGERRISYLSLLDKPDLFDGTKIKGQLYLHVLGKPPLKLERDEEDPDLLTMIEIRRHDETKAYLALDENDHLVILAADGETVLVEFDTDDTRDFSIAIRRDWPSPEILPGIAIKRNDTVLGYIGSNAADSVAFIGADGTTELAAISDVGEFSAQFRVLAPSLKATTETISPVYKDEDENVVLRHQLPAIADGVATTDSPAGSDGTGGAPGDPATLGDVDGVYAVTNGLEASVADALATAITALEKANAALGAQRAHGQIAT